MKRRILALLILPCVLASVAAAQTATNYYAILLQGKKMGHQVTTRTASRSKVTTTVSMQIAITRGDVPILIRIKQTFVETAKGAPISFKLSQEVSGMTSQSEGVLKRDGKMEVRTTMAGQKQTRTIEYPKGALMAEGMRLLTRKKGLAEGATYKALAFDPSLMTAMDANVSVGARESVDLLGRVVKLVKVTTVLKARVGKIEAVSYVNDDCEEQKTVIPLMGMQLEVIACSKTYAMSENDPADFFSKIFLKSPKPLPNVRRAKSVTYRLTPTADAKVHFPKTGSQSVRPGPGKSFTVTVKPVAMPTGVKFPYKGTDAAAVEALRATTYVQSEDKKVVALARKAVAGAADAGQAVRRIEKFVRKYITTKDLSVGYASAAEVAESRQGDCTEHAVLAAAMCRAVGIPAQLVVGFAYAPSFAGKKNIFAPHAWTRALVGKTWVEIDAALDGFDAGRLALSINNGDPDGFFAMINTIGYFKITAVEVAE